MEVMVFRLMTDLIEQCRVLTTEVLRTFEYLREHAPVKLRYAQAGLRQGERDKKVLEEWAAETDRVLEEASFVTAGESRTRPTSAAGAKAGGVLTVGKMLSFRKWVRLLRGLFVSVGYEYEFGDETEDPIVGTEEEPPGEEGGQEEGGMGMEIGIDDDGDEGSKWNGKEALR
jgi:hypothetical protein